MTALSGEPGDAPRPDGAAPQQGSDAGARAGQRASLTFLGLLLCSAVFAVGYRLLMRSNLGQGAALFIGLPVILGAVIAMATAPRSALGMTLKVTALCMCVIAPLLGEGAVCLAMAAPLVFGVIGITAFLIRIFSGGAGRGQVSCCALLVGLSPLLWEPAAKQAGWQDRRPLQEVSSSIEVAAAPGAVWRALAAPPRDLFAAPLPGFLRLRLSPGPRAVTGGGLQLGAARQVRLDNDRYRATVRRSEPGRLVTFTITEEEAAAPGERVALWLRFVEVEFQLTDLGGDRTRLTQRTRYRRLLDPGFYFGPLERWGVRAMHGYTLALFADSASAPTPTAVAVR